MTSGGVRWWLLGEDKLHERLGLELMRELGFKRQPVKVFISPSGRGAASGWVLSQYASVARNTVRRRRGERVVLLVLIDGDNEGTRVRKAQLERALAERGEEPRSAVEPIVVLTPTWSIETWLVGFPPDLSENISFKDRVRTPSANDFSQAVVRALRPAENEPLASVRDAHEELERVVDS